ncbi:hypothetical protein RDI58_022428 [Solanum bulbocastanum]|uniref:RNase H type-1 domain-containing protein n=1 Tax=Solanum bulbocastanum TaxID=147425 RepID=A0AAN8T5R5_SOLBU
MTKFKRRGVVLCSRCNCCTNYELKNIPHLFGKSLIAKRCVPILVCWEILKNRCLSRFENMNTSDSKLGGKCVHLENLHQSINSQLVKWHKPEEEWVELNVDGCSKGNPESAGGGGVIRDHRRIVIKGFIDYNGMCSNNIAEATTPLQGIKLCIDIGKGFVVVVSDSLLIMEIINRSQTTLAY